MTFELFFISFKLGLDKNTNPAIVGYYIWNNTLAKASIVSYYERKKSN